MNTPTTEQLTVLNSRARIRVVRAAPGSGKTWLVAETIRRAIPIWTGKGSGIAALSFTRVGGEEIRKAVGYELDHPHYIGTLDAFLFRYVVRPFLTDVYPQYARPRLIPADWSPHYWRKGPAGVQLTVPPAKGAQRAPIHILEACFIGETNGRIDIGCPKPYRSGLQPLPEQMAKTVLAAKEQLWRRAGWLTHSDAAFLAAHVLSHKTKGLLVIAEIARRFPFMIVDELQDTGWFLGKAVETLLVAKGIRGLLVGDPDQAIFEFNGARPDLFDRFAKLPDAVELPLLSTRRCCGPVCRAAEHLAQSGRHIAEADGHVGRAILLHYTDFVGEVNGLRCHLHKKGGSRCVKVVARLRNTVDSLLGTQGIEMPAIGSPPLNHLHRAVNHYRLGQQTRALAEARAALDLAVFDEEGIEDERLAKDGIEPSNWKRLAIECLFAANEDIPGETLFDWGQRTITIICDRIKRLYMATSVVLNAPTIRNPARKHQASMRDGYLFKPTPAPQSNPSPLVQTVHSVKGETHDLTILVCPPAGKATHCPSNIWWSADPSDLEERRIAFVAMTRSRADFILCVSSECLTRLKSTRPTFIERFECKTIAEFIKDECGSTRLVPLAKASLEVVGERQ